MRPSPIRACVLLILAVTVLSAGFHEFGHAAAARRGGATPGAMGTGLYLIWPAFFTDVTDSYRLGRAGRIRTDLGGLYFNAIVAVAIMGIWWATGFDALLLVVVTQVLQMVRQLLPLVRFDGYHILADATGVPDLFQRIKPTLLGLLPWRRNDPEAQVLKPWARAVVTAWVLITVPLLLFSLVIDGAVPAAAPRHRVGQRAEAVRHVQPAASPAGTSSTPQCGSWRSPPSRFPWWASSTSCSAWAGRSSAASGRRPAARRSSAGRPSP